jgi:autotransporter-associated beta strand protein
VPGRFRHPSIVTERCSVAWRFREVVRAALLIFRTAYGLWPMLAVVLSAGALSTPLHAQTTNWSTGTGSWFTPANWDNGIPTPATTDSNVINGGTAQIAGGAANTGNTLTISGGSTVDLQAGGSLTSGTVVLGNNGTLLLSGSTAVGVNCVPSPGCIGFVNFSGIEFNGGTVRSTTSGSMPSSIRFAPDASGTILATAGQTLTISGDLFHLGDFFENNVHATFGSATNTGTVVLAPVEIATSFAQGSNGTIEVAGGTLRSGSGISGFARATIVDAGAKLDLSQTTTQAVFNLLGAGQVLTGSNPSTVLTINQGDFSGQITGAARVQFVGDIFTCFFCPPIIGTLRLSGVNTYTGGTTISRGILEMGNIGSLGAGPVTIDGGVFPLTQLRSSVSGTLANDFTLQGRVVGISATTGQTLTLASGNFTFANTSNPFINFGTPTDTGTVVFAPTTISMPVPYSIEIDGGTLRAGNSQLSTMTAVAPTTLIGLGTLDLNGFPTTIKNLNSAATGAGFVKVDGTTLSLVNGNFAGTISGAGRLQQLSGGTTILSGTNTYSGGTVINSNGKLQLGTGGTSGSIVGDVANDGTLTINRAGTFALGGTISGIGTFNQIGSGNTLLTASNNYTGATTVNAGTLSVNGSIASSSLTTVNTGGTLGGNGIVGNTNINGGTLSPGNSIGTLTVQGSLVFTAASSYMIEVSPANADRVNVIGNATLGSATVNANFAAGTYVAKQYTIVNAAGGINSTFGAQVNTNLPSGFHSSLSYDANNAYLNLALNFIPPPSGGLSGNQQNVANAIVGFFDGNGSIPIVFGGLTPAGLTQVSGETATGSQQTTFDAMTQFITTLLDPFVSGRGDASAPSTGATPFAEEGDAANAYAAAGRKRNGAERDAYGMITKAAPRNPVFDPRWSVWAAGFGGSQTTDGNAALGSNNTTSRVFGVAAGADYIFSPGTIGGFALAGGATQFSVANGGTGRSDLFQAGAFIRHKVGAAYVSGALAYGWQDITTDRTVTIAGVDQLRAKFNANAFSGRVEGGYRFVTPWIGITPYAAGQFTTFDLPAYAEQVLLGASTFALAYGSKSVTASRSELGVRTDKSWAMQNAILTLRGRFAWAHDFNPDRNIAATFQTLPGASFVVNGAAQASDPALTTASIEMKWRNGWSAAAIFEGEFSDVTRSYAGKGVARYAW